MKLCTFVCAFLMTGSAFAEEIYSGKCAKVAEKIAINQWTNVDNRGPAADPYITYQTASSKASTLNGKNYAVVLVLNNGNEFFYGRYRVAFQDLENCSGGHIALY